MSPTEPPPAESYRLIYGGLLGLTAAGVLQLFDRPLSWPLTIAFYAFAGSIPLLAASLVAEIASARRPTARRSAGGREGLGFVAAVGAVVGLAGCIFHVGVGPGVVFCGAVAAAVVCVRLLNRYG